MQDLVPSLKWIRDNIAAFGGDPDNVMISRRGLLQRGEDSMASGFWKRNLWVCFFGPNWARFKYLPTPVRAS